MNEHLTAVASQLWLPAVMFSIVRIDLACGHGIDRPSHPISSHPFPIPSHISPTRKICLTLLSQGEGNECHRVCSALGIGFVERLSFCVLLALARFWVILATFEKCFFFHSRVVHRVIFVTSSIGFVCHRVVAHSQRWGRCSALSVLELLLAFLSQIPTYNTFVLVYGLFFFFFLVCLFFCLFCLFFSFLKSFVFPCVV